MTAEKNKTKDLWMILGVILLVGGVLAAMLWLLPGKEQIPRPTQSLTTGAENVTVPTETTPISEPDADPIPDVDVEPNVTTVSTTAPTDSASEPVTEPDAVPEENVPSDATTEPTSQVEETTEPEVTTSAPVETTPPETTTAPVETAPPETTTVAPTTPPAQQLICADYGLFNGVFVEDGSDQPVENVAALLVTNGSDQYLDLAKLTYELDGEEAVFMVTGLPAGTSAWVLESSRKTVTGDTTFRHLDTITSYRANAVNTLEGLQLQASDTMLKATNETDKTLREVTVYYKVLHEDGNYLGGITYMINFGDLEPGQSAEKIAGHFQSGKTHIVRIGYQE